MLLQTAKKLIFRIHVAFIKCAVNTSMDYQHDMDICNALFQSIVPAFVWGDFRKPQEFSVGIDVNLVKTHTRKVCTPPPYIHMIRVLQHQPVRFTNLILQWLAFLHRNQKFRVRILAWRPLTLTKISNHLSHSFNERGKIVISSEVQLLLRSRCFFLAYFPYFEKIN
jgi:hypothetical protein